MTFTTRQLARSWHLSTSRALRYAKECGFTPVGHRATNGGPERLWSLAHVVGGLLLPQLELKGSVPRETARAMAHVVGSMSDEHLEHVLLVEQRRFVVVCRGSVFPELASSPLVQHMLDFGGAELKKQGLALIAFDIKPLWESTKEAMAQIVQAEAGEVADAAD